MYIVGLTFKFLKLFKVVVMDLMVVLYTRMWVAKP